MGTLHLDTETWSEISLKKAGAFRYAEACETMLVPWAVDDGPVEVWDLTVPGGYTLRDVQALIDEADTVVCHNSPFERRTLLHQGVNLPVEKIEDTMVLALAHGLPGKLEQLCEALNVPADKEKDKSGKKLIQLFTKPRPKNVKLRRATRETHPDEWGAFIQYAGRDVVAMRDVRQRAPRWNVSDGERALWLLDQAAADFGFAIDLEHARSAIRAFERASRSLAARTAQLTNNVVGSTTQRDALLAYLEAQFGFSMPDMTKDTVEAMLRRDDLHPEVRALLLLRSEAAATTPSKYRALIEATGTDGRLRGAVQFCGAARTGRDAGRIFQPQNLIRSPGWFNLDVQETVISAFKAECEDLLWDDIVDRVSFAVRGAVVAPPGKKFVISDLSNIEGRVAAWLAGETWKLQAFRDYDAGLGPDLYKIGAGKILGKDPHEVTKDERQKIGKVSELAGQFGGALGAYRTMGGAAIDSMSDEEVLVIVRGWRAAHPAIKNYWYDLENAARAAINNLGESFTCGLITFDCVPDKHGATWLRMKLPSDRYLVYKDPEGGVTTCGTCRGESVVQVGEVYETCPDCAGKGSWGSAEISYMGVDQYTRQWKRQRTYGGKLFENAVQAVARDVFFSGFRRAMEDFKWEPIYGDVRQDDGRVIQAVVMWRGTNAAGAVVLRVHDELVCEVPDTDEYTVDRLSAHLATNPGWAAGLPLAAAGFEARRYRKGD